MTGPQLLRKHRKLAIASTIAVVLGVAGIALARRSSAAAHVPTAEVKVSEFVDYVQIRGEVKAIRSTVLNAPSGVGQLQIIQLARNGSMVKKGDVLVQFDTTQQRNTMEQKRSELKQAEAEIENTRAQARMKEEQDVTDLAKARYDVERARLDAGKQEILSQIDGEKAKLALADAEQRLREAEQKLKSDRIASSADVESKKKKRDKALFDLRQAENNIAKMTLRAPSDGMITILTTWRGPNNTSEFRQGDNAWPGAPIVELPDLSSIQVSGRVDETDRGRLAAAQSTTVRVDAVPDTDFSGSVAQISPLTKIDFSNWPPQRNFDVTIKIDKGDPRLRPGMNATARVAVDRITDAVIIPADACFDKRGRSIVYVQRGTKFEERSITVKRRSNGQVAVASGLKPGERVAMRDMSAQEQPTP